jgi:hypothetical protein
MRWLRAGLAICSVFFSGLIAFSGVAVAENAPVMTLPGQFNVGPSGAAAYSIPISVPPGTAGMAPTLSLDYSSKGSNGLVGLG